MADEVLLEREGHVLLIGVNRPDKYNAWDLATIAGVCEGVTLLSDDDDLWCGVIHGVGDHFSAGLALDEVGPAVREGGFGSVMPSGGRDPFGVWREPPTKPVVLAVQGIAFTLSIELALAADIVVAADDVRFAQLEIARGIFPFGGGTFRAPERLGWGNAMRFLLTAEEFGAEEAHRIGLVQEVVPSGQQLQRAKELAHLIAEQAPRGVQVTLANARIGRDQGEAAARDHLAAQLTSTMGSEDAQEGVRSFLERRKARFTGR